MQFSEIVVFLRTTIFEGPAARQVFREFKIFSVLSSNLFLSAPELPFLGSGRFRGRPKPTLTLQKQWKRLIENACSEQSCFFTEKSRFWQNMISTKIGASTITQNEPKRGLASGLDRSLFRYREPSSTWDPPGIPLGSLLELISNDFGLILRWFGIDFWIVGAWLVVPETELSEVTFTPKPPKTSKTFKISDHMAWRRRLGYNGTTVEVFPSTKVGGGGASP